LSKNELARYSLVLATHSDSGLQCCIMAVADVSCCGKTYASRSRAIMSIERQLTMGGRWLAARASAWRVAIGVQHPRGLVAFAAPGRWRQLGQGEPGREHGTGVADPGSVRPGELGQRARRPA
jgi:hypothetical protein